MGQRPKVIRIRTITQKDQNGEPTFRVVTYRNEGPTFYFPREPICFLETQQVDRVHEFSDFISAFNLYKDELCMHFNRDDRETRLTWLLEDNEYYRSGPPMW